MAKILLVPFFSGHGVYALGSLWREHDKNLNTKTKLFQTSNQAETDDAYC